MSEIKDQRVILKVTGMTLTAELLDTPTARAVIGAIPCTARIQTWGKEIYFPLPLGVDAEAGAREVVAAGELAYWPAGGCIAVGFGPTPASRGDEIRLAGPVNIWGRADAAAVRELAAAAAGDTVTMELEEAGTA